MAENIRKPLAIGVFTPTLATSFTISSSVISIFGTTGISERGYLGGRPRRRFTSGMDSVMDGGGTFLVLLLREYS